MSDDHSPGVLLPGALSGAQNSGSHRPRSAPPAVAANMAFNYGAGADGMDGGSNLVDVQVRGSLEYYKYYHSQKPLDPRLPPPLYNWSALVNIHEGEEGALGLDSALQNLTVAEEENEYDDHDAGEELNSLYKEASGLMPHLEDGHDQGWAGPGGSGGGVLEPVVASTLEAMAAPGAAGGGGDWETMSSIRKSVFDRIQEDFPRTPSPVFAMGQAPASGGKPAHSKALPSPSSKAKKPQMQIIEAEVRERPLSAQGGAGGGAGGEAYYGANGEMQGGGGATLLQSMGLVHPQLQQLMQSPNRMTLPPGVSLQMLQMAQEAGGGLEMGDDGLGGGMGGMGMQDLQQQMLRQLLLQQQQQQQYGMQQMAGMQAGMGAGVHPAQFQRGGMMGGMGGEGGRCGLLEEFRSSKSRKLELRDIMEHCDEFCRDQHGSRFIQTKLDGASPADKQMVFDALLPNALSLMTDLFGNYVVQKFMERGTPEHRGMLAHAMQGKVLELSLDMYGCRVVQKAIEVVEREQQEQLVGELQGSVMKCVRDQNGNHVIQKCIERASAEAAQFIVDDFVGQVVQLATHPYGCRVIQRILEHCQHAQVAPILEEIVNSTRDLVHDQYGNYVVQHVLEHGQPRDRQSILTRVGGQIVAMSQHKFASNVVEKLLQFSTPETRPAMLNEMTGEYMGQPSVLVMMRDAYGNYVIQKALDVCQGADRDRLISAIRDHLPAVRKFTYGKHIIAHIDKLEAQKYGAGRGGQPGGLGMHGMGRNGMPPGGGMGGGRGGMGGGYVGGMGGFGGVGGGGMGGLGPLNPLMMPPGGG